MIWRTTFVALLMAALLAACADRERVNCPQTLTKNKALRSTVVTSDTLAVSAFNVPVNRCR